ncbi:MAG TPA: glycosyltransferase family 4 protein [Blastocatellia bacterium]|nr:glycosyltransferase family 4 protein [Blastocatellia bacterium]
MQNRGKRILLLLPEVFGSAGGIQMFCRALCYGAGRWAQKNGAEVSALVLNDNAAPDARYVDGGFRSYITSGGSKAKFIKSYVQQSAAFNPDLVIVGHISLSPLSLISRRAKSCVIAYGIEAWRKLSQVEKRALERAERLLAISEYTRSELCRLNSLPETKVDIFPCSLDPHWTAEELPAPETASPPLLLTVSRLNQSDSYKGVDSVIECLPDVVDCVGPVDYRIVGGGDDMPRLRALAERLGIIDYVTFTGEVSDGQLRDLYKRCSLFVMPSEAEGFGIVFLEAMAYGKPIIGGAHAATPSVVEHEQTGLLVERKDVAAIAQSIIRILKDDDLRLRLGSAGRRRLVDRFTFESFESNLDHLLKVLSAES